MGACARSDLRNCWPNFLSFSIDNVPDSRSPNVGNSEGLLRRPVEKLIIKKKKKIFVITKLLYYAKQMFFILRRSNNSIANSLDRRIN